VVFALIRDEPKNQREVINVRIGVLAADRMKNNRKYDLAETRHNHPFVSVIIPVYNDRVGIQETLLSLFRQNYPMDRYEIIVIDNNSTDNTGALIGKTVSGFVGNIVVETEKRPGSYAARNKGISVSQGEIIAFIDSNMTVEPDWLCKGVERIVHGEVDYVGCRIQIFSRKRKPSLWEKYQIALGFPVKDYMEIDGYAPTASLFVRRKVIDEAGKFEAGLFSGGDVEFGTRVRDRGFKMSYDSDNLMYHPARRSFQSLLKKQKRVTLGQIKLRRLFPERFKKNSIKDIVICCIQCFPVVSPGILLKLSGSGADFFPLFMGFYVLRLYTNYLKVIHKSLF